MISKSSTLAAIVALSSSSSTDAFSHAGMKTKPSQSKHSFPQLKYRSLHHGPDIEPLTESEKLGRDFTKMAKEHIDRFGPGSFEQFADFPSDQFDGGDSDMGLSGDGTVGMKKLGRDVSPHLARTWSARMSSEDEVHQRHQMGVVLSYAEDLSERNPGMDGVRAQQLENWATQKEIALQNRNMYERTQGSCGLHDNDVYQDNFEFPSPIEVGGEFEGTISLMAPVHGVGRHDILLKNPYMGFATFRAAFVGDEGMQWTVTPSDGYLKQHEETYFAIGFRPHSHGVSQAYLVIETEDFKKTWKVVGSTGEYEF